MKLYFRQNSKQSEDDLVLKQVINYFKMFKKFLKWFTSQTFKYCVLEDNDDFSLTIIKTPTIPVLPRTGWLALFGRGLRSTVDGNRLKRANQKSCSSNMKLFLFTEYYCFVRSDHFYVHII